MRALDAVANLSGRGRVSDLIDLLLSEHDLHPLIRRELANALSDGRLTLNRKPKGARGPRKRSMAATLKEISFRLEVGGFANDLIQNGAVEKNAVLDTADEFDVSPKFARACLRSFERWKYELDHGSGE